MKKIIGLLLCSIVLFGCSNASSTNTSSSSLIAEKGDIVKIDFVGTMDGKEFDGGSAQNQIAELGAGGYIEGFEEGIIGMKKGETKDVKMKFPDNYYEELAGKEVVFKITVNKIYREVK